MARRPRLFAPGLLYHVIARGNQRRETFLDIVLVRRFGYRLSDVARALRRDPATLGTAVSRLAERLTRDSALARTAGRLEKCREVKV